MLTAALLCAGQIFTIEAAEYTGQQTVDSAPSSTVSVNSFVDSYEFVYTARVSDELQKSYKEIIKKSVSSNKLNIDSVAKLMPYFDKMFAQENGIEVYESRAGFWDGQGFTVGEVGGIIDAALWGLVGGMAVSGLKAAGSALIKKYGLSGVASTIIAKLNGIGLAQFGKFVTGILVAALQTHGPGYYIASYFDRYDAYPNNGRINLWR